MVRSVIGVVVGFVAMVVLVMVGLFVMWGVLGAEGAFQPASWDASMGWIVGMLASGLVAAIVGGALCKLIARSRRAVTALAVVVALMGCLSLVGQLGREAPEGARPADVPFAEAGANAVQPMWVTIANPIIGIVGVLIGGSLVGRRPAES